MDSNERQHFKDSVIGMFDRAAPIYGQVGIQQFTYFGNWLVEQLEVPAGAQVLDVATGRGAILFPLAEKVGASGHVLGIDLAPTMVAETAAEITRRGLTQAEVRVMDGDKVDFPPQSFDLITCGFALHFLDYEHTLPKLRTMLKPDGVFAAITPFVPRDENLARWKWLFELTRAVFPEGFVPPSAWIAPNKISTPELIGAALKDAGFSNVQTQEHTATLYFRDEDDWWDWEWSQGSRFWLEGMSPEGLERFKRESFGHLRGMQTADGIPSTMGVVMAVGHK